jgi:hypothetical protein
MRILLTRRAGFVRFEKGAVPFKLYRERKMKKLKNLAERHPFGISVIGASVLVITGHLLGKINPLWYLLDFPAILLCLLILFFQTNKKWVCTKCGAKEFFGRCNFCSICGGVMHSVKKERGRCPRGHRVEKYDKFCSRCGVSLLAGNSSIKGRF